MAIRNNLLTIEDEIAALLSNVKTLKNIYRHPIDIGLTGLTASVPCAVIENKGFIPKEFAGSRQMITTFWQVGVVCARADYLSVGGAVVADVIESLLAKKHEQWINKARLSQKSLNSNNQPDFDGELAFYPALFEIDIAFKVNNI